MFIERRSFVAGLGALVLSAWLGLGLLVPGLMWSSRVTLPVWLLVYAGYLADRKLRFRLFYEGLIGTAAYWLLHDVPSMLRLHALMPATAGNFLVLLVATGALAALPFGRRGPAVAGVSGALLGALWIIYEAGRNARLAHPLHELGEHVLPAVAFMMLGGLAVERLTRGVRGDRAHTGPQAALWAFVIGVVLTRCLALW